MFEILRTDTIFQISPCEGTADCVCSRCGALVPDSAVALRAFIDGGHGGEYRYCDRCQERMGFWSHDHTPALEHSEPTSWGWASRDVYNACGECGQRIERLGGKWRLAQIHDFFRRMIVERLPSTDGTEQVTLGCHHVIIRIIPDHKAAVMDCPECVNEYIAKVRSSTTQGESHANTTV